MMVNYSLEEFKAWLEEKPERKEGTTYATWGRIGNDDDLEKLIKRIDIPQISHFSNSSWTPYRQVALKWKAEVDQRERERESKFRGGRE